MKTNQELIDHIRIKAPLYLDSNERSERTLEAMLKVDRSQFIPKFSRLFAYEDRPLPIGNNQTCSQPSMVAFMLDKCQIQPGNKVLEIGSGCGYAAAIASHLCGPTGRIFASEIIEDLAEKLSKNLQQYNNISVIAGDGSMGFPEQAPFDRILLSAGVATPHFKRELLLSQLTDNGILIYPEAYGNIYVIKKSDGHLSEEIFYGVSFVPLRGKNS